MYNSVSFNFCDRVKVKQFNSSVLSAYKVLTDIDYYHCVDEDERLHYNDNVISFIRCTEGSIKIYTQSETYTLYQNDCIFLYFKDIKKYMSLSSILEYRWVNFTAKITIHFLKQNLNTAFYTLPKRSIASINSLNAARISRTAKIM